MQSLIVIAAVSAVLLYEGARRILAADRVHLGAVALALGVACLSVLALAEYSAHHLATTMASSSEPFHMKPPWSDPRTVLPNLRMAERAEKTRILAVNYYTDTGLLIRHLAPQGEVVLFTPTQEEVALREAVLSITVSTRTAVTYTRTNLADLLFIPVFAFAGAFLVTRKRRTRGA